MTKISSLHRLRIWLGTIGITYLRGMSYVFGGKPTFGLDSRKRSDREAQRSDWQKVGQDMWKGFDRAKMEVRDMKSSGDGQEESEFEERARLIEKMLDDLYPFKPDMSDSEREALDNERQMLVLRTGWGGMPIGELRKLSRGLLPRESATGMIAMLNYTGTDFYCDLAIPKKVPLEVVHEDQHVLAFHHTKPAYPTHIVIVPKKHIPSFTNVDAEDFNLLRYLLEEVRRIAADIEKTHGKARVITNLGEYQDSKHLHFHVVSGDKYK